MSKISVVCVTNRKSAKEFLFAQLDKQTFKDFEVIVADDSIWDCSCEKDKWREHTMIIRPSGEYWGGCHFHPRQKQEGDVWNLNKAYNDCLKRAKGELIVFLQDFINIPANGLQRYWDMYQLYPKDLVTGCGHKYENEKIVETDDRVFGERQIVPSDWTYFELNWAACPRTSLVHFEEDMDKFYGGENQIFALKALLEHGAQVWLDRKNECRGLAHHDRPENWEEMHSNKFNRLNEKIKEIY